jgi:hypothetical protein
MIQKHISNYVLKCRQDGIVNVRLTCKTWPSLQAMRPLEGSLCHCLDLHTGHRRRAMDDQIAAASTHVANLFYICTAITCTLFATTTSKASNEAVLPLRPPGCSGSHCISVIIKFSSINARPRLTNVLLKQMGESESVCPWGTPKPTMNHRKTMRYLIS